MTTTKEQPTFLDTMSEIAACLYMKSEPDIEMIVLMVYLLIIFKIAHIYLKSTFHYCSLVC